MRFIRGTKIVVVAAVATTMAFVGVAYAAFDGVIVGSDGVIYACAKSDGVVRLAGSSRTCDASEKAFNWNQRGPQGSTGPRGPAGPAYFARVSTTDNNTLKAAQITIKAWDYSDGTIWLNVPDRDVRQCAVTATPVSGSPGATVVRQQVDYSNWILLYTYASGTRQQMAADVMLACAY